MQLFSDRLVASIRKAGNPCVVGLDPRIDQMPAFIKSGRGRPTKEVVRSIIRDFHELVLDSVTGLVPAVKPQLAFFEQYGSAGITAFEDTVQAAKERGLLVIADGKRNDIASTPRRPKPTPRHSSAKQTSWGTSRKCSTRIA